LVRFVISDVAEGFCRFEQSFSADGGKTWEVNWIATDTRMPVTDRPHPMALDGFAHSRTSRLKASP